MSESQSDQREPESDDAVPVEPRRTFGVRRLLPYLVAAIVLALGLRFAPGLRELLDDLAQLKATLRQAGPWGPVAFFGLCLLGMPLGLPRLSFSFAAGLLFGAALGLPLALFGTTAGAWLVFLFTRHLGRDFGLNTERLARYRWTRRLDSPGIGTIFLLRQVPLPGVAVNVTMGLSRCSQGIFLGGTLLGYFPQAAVAVLAGSGLGKSSGEKAAWQLGGAVLAALVLGLLAWRAGAFSGEVDEGARP